MIKLPIDDILPDFAASLEKFTSFILKASPGSGKTTRLPPLLAQNLSGQIIVLEPRRLAAKMSATRIAEEQGLTLGEEIGYVFRYESAYGPKTKILFMTEGTFLRKLEHDPELKNISAIVIDEFHERHLETDVILSLVRSLQQKRADLKIIVMSATIQTEALATYLGAPRVFDLELPLYPLEIKYLDNVPSILNQSLEKKVYQGIKQYWDHTGDILIFLSGMGEIKRVYESLGEFQKYALILHGDLNPDEQKMAVSPGPQRKIILSTNIAESSVTIPGVRIVIDGGMHREASYSPWSGLKHLVDKKISQSSCIQRAGRAAREDKGHCLRLYAKMDYESRPYETKPEIERSDLSEILLYMSSLPLEVSWFHSPPKEFLTSAYDSLHAIGALENFKLAPVGKKMLRYHLPPRLSRTLVAAEKAKPEIKKNLLNHLVQWVEPFDSKRLFKRLAFFLDSSGEEDKDIAYYYLMGMWEQIVQFKNDLEKGINLKGEQLKKRHDFQDEFILALEINHRQEIEAFLPVLPEWFYDITPFPLKEGNHIVFDDKRNRIIVTEAVYLGILKISEEAISNHFDSLIPEVKEKVLTISEKRVDRYVQSLKDNSAWQRLLYIQQDLELMPVNLRDILSTYYQEKWNLDESSFTQFYLEEYARTLEQESGLYLREKYPLEVKLSNQKNLTVHYTIGEAPFLMSYIQDFYGLKETPSLNNGQKLTLKLNGPHGRPIQVTNDLARFWVKTYQELLKEFNREYPRHFWPANPAEAKPFLLLRQMKAQIEK
ncbi:MAG: ATP-dependent helicase C-terminal domain-containing protein [Bacteriovoracaceae bacterium]